jgi:hypothetical protein
MTDLFLTINVFLAVLFWRASTEAFNQGANHAGWFFVFFSAYNSASLMATIL